MIRAEQIPDEVVEAAARAYAILNEGHDEWWHLRAERTRAAIAAALSVWPGANVIPGMQRGMRETKPIIVLPLPQDKTND